MLTLAIFLTFLSACTVSKVEVSIPTDAFPNEYRTNYLMTDSIDIGQLDWRSYFQDECLIQLIDNALTRNSDVLIALQNIEISKLQLKRAQWRNIPNLQLDIKSSTDYPSEYNLLNIENKQNIEDFQIDFGLNWEADIWGKIKNQKKVAIANYLQSEEVKKLIQTTLIAQIAQCYYNLMILDNQVALAYKNMEINDDIKKTTNLQFLAGKNTSLAVEQSEVQGLNVKKIITDLQLQIFLQENILSTLTGTFPSPQQRQQFLENSRMSKNIQTGIPTILLAQRPDVKSAELDLEIANAEVGIAQAAFYPSLTLNANVGLQSFKMSDWFNIPASLFGIVAGGISQPILQKRKIKTNHQISLANREKTVIKFRGVILNAVSEVSNALVQIDKQTEQQEILAKQRFILESNIEKTKLLFSSGQANYLEILTVQNNLLNCDMDYNISKRKELFARIELYRALGGGWR
ncbi:NodT family efflux transporter outer membrane factor (OMF) lipoprotein [Sphingobacterium sp. JUb78]|nr:NodT family efflux transporter outer membrane factor (OMF) lipoprotein [Sphingobacterium sp. JUb78]